MVPIYVTTTNDTDPVLTRRKINEAFRAGHQAMGRLWADKLLHEHFRPSAFRELDYQPRNPTYNKIKDKLFRRGAVIKRTGKRVIAGSDTPLVLTGVLREQVLTSAAANVRAFPSRVTINMSGPVYFTLRPWKSKTTIRIAREVLAVSNRHAQMLSEACQLGYNTALDRLKFSAALRSVRRAA
jgi:hypothetical protein